MSTARPDTDHSESRGLVRDRAIAGAAGIVFCLWMLVAAAIFAAIIPMPAFSDPASYQSSYFADNGQALMAHAWFSGLFWLFGFLTFAAGLRRQLGAGDPAGAMWADVAWAGAILATAFGGAGLIFQTVAALMPDPTSDLVPVLGRMLAVIDQTLLYWGLGLFVAGASVAILRSGALGRGLAWAGLAVALLLVIGAAWPLTGGDRDLLGGLGLLGLFAVAVWILVVGAALIRSARRLPAGLRPTGARDASTAAVAATGGPPSRS